MDSAVVTLPSTDWRKNRSNRHGSVRFIPRQLIVAGEELINRMSMQYELTGRALTDFCAEHGLSVPQAPGHDDHRISADNIDLMGGSATPDVQIVVYKQQLVDMCDFILTLSFEAVRNGAPMQLQTRLNQARPEIIKLLPQFGRVGQAYELAEKFRDYYTLIDLIADNEPHGDQSLDHLYSVCGDEFAFVLYDWLLDKRTRVRCDTLNSVDKMGALLELGDQHNRPLREYLTERNRHDLLWIHELRCQHYDKASEHANANVSLAKTMKEKEVIVCRGCR
jgi:hypothetical protein